MKRLLLCILVITLLAGCGGSFAVEDVNKNFKLRNVSTVTLSGPNSTDSEGTSIELQPGKGDYTTLVQLVKGERLTQCPTDSFGLSVITYTIVNGETVKVYPANDGSNYICLFSLNPTIAQYLEITEESMKEIHRILEANNIQAVYQ